MRQASLREHFENFIHLHFPNGWTSQTSIDFADLCRRLELADLYMKEHNNG